MKMVKCYRRSISASDLWVSSNEKLSDFYAGAWQQGDSAMPLLVVRLMVTLVALSILVWSVYEAPYPYWLLYLTNWGLLLITLMMISGVFVSYKAIDEKLSESEILGKKELPWYMSVYWLMYNLSISLAFMITALYWILLYDHETMILMKEDELGKRLFWLEVSAHAINSCVALIELLVSRTPVSFLHIYQPVGLGLWYAGFTAIYYSAGGKDINGFPFIYEILDWRQARRSGIVVAASFVGLLIIYSIVWGIALGRDKLSENFLRTTTVALSYTPRDQHMPLPSDHV